MRSTTASHRIPRPRGRHRLDTLIRHDERDVCGDHCSGEHTRDAPSVFGPVIAWSQS